MSHKSDVLEFVLCLGALFFFSSWLKLNLRQGRWECGLIEITEGSLHCFLPLSHLLWPLSPPFSSSLYTHGKPRRICLACWGICDWRTLWTPKFPFLTSAPPAGFKQTCSYFPSLDFHPDTIARPHNSPFGKTLMLSLPSGLHRQPGCRLSTPKQLFIYACMLSHSVVSNPMDHSPPGSSVHEILQQ